MDSSCDNMTRSKSHSAFTCGFNIARSDWKRSVNHAVWWYVAVIMGRDRVISFPKTTTTKNDRPDPMSKKIIKEALKRLSLTFREFHQLTHRYFRFTSPIFRKHPKHIWLLADVSLPRFLRLHLPVGGTNTGGKEARVHSEWGRGWGSNMIHI